MNNSNSRASNFYKFSFPSELLSVNFETLTPHIGRASRHSQYTEGSEQAFLLESVRPGMATHMAENPATIFPNSIEIRGDVAQFGQSGFALKTKVEDRPQGLQPAPKVAVRDVNEIVRAYLVVGSSPTISVGLDCPNYQPDGISSRILVDYQVRPSFFFPKPLQFGRNTNMPSYKYEYENSVSSLQEVEEALRSEYRSPDFARNVEVALTTTLSEASVSIHLRELVDRDRAVKVGKTYIHVDNIEKQEVWQLERVLDRLDNKNTMTEKIQQRLEKKIELRREQFQELKEELSSRQTEREIEEINSLMDSRNYYEEKQRQLKKDIRKVFGMIDFVKNPNSKESCDAEGFPIDEGGRVLA